MRYMMMNSSAKWSTLMQVILTSRLETAIKDYSTFNILTKLGLEKADYLITRHSKQFKASHTL